MRRVWHPVWCCKANACLPCDRYGKVWEAGKARSCRIPRSLSRRSFNEGGAAIFILNRKSRHKAKSKSASENCNLLFYLISNIAAHFCQSHLFHFFQILFQKLCNFVNKYLHFIVLHAILYQ